MKKEYPLVLQQRGRILQSPVGTYQLSSYSRQESTSRLWARPREGTHSIYIYNYLPVQDILLLLYIQYISGFHQRKKSLSLLYSLFCQEWKAGKHFLWRFCWDKNLPGTRICNKIHLNKVFKILPSQFLDYVSLACLTGTSYEKTFLIFRVKEFLYIPINFTAQNIIIPFFFILSN